jgi:hypothetical protein
VFSASGRVQELVHSLKYNGRKDAGIAVIRLCFARYFTIFNSRHDSACSITRK